jgi:predicted nucleotidyltransferase
LDNTLHRSIEQRKSDEAARRAAIPLMLKVRLEDFARRCRGRYLIYGSLARGAARYDSDIDILVDFPPEFEAEAWRRIEKACAEERIESDIVPLAWRHTSFLERALKEVEIIG